jgi:hypothetical protein
LHAPALLCYVLVAWDDSHHCLEDDAGSLQCLLKALYPTWYHQNEYEVQLSPDAPCSLHSKVHVLDDQVLIQAGEAGMVSLVPAAPSLVAVQQLMQKVLPQPLQLGGQKKVQCVPPLSFLLTADYHVQLPPEKVNYHAGQTAVPYHFRPFDPGNQILSDAMSHEHAQV